MAAGGGQHRRHNRYHHPVHDWSASSWPETRTFVGVCGGDDGYGGGLWPPKKYTCSFCRREFRSAQALGGHMNVHRRDRARLRQASPPTAASSSSSATNSATADPQEYHPLITTAGSAPLPSPPLVNKISSGGSSTSLNSCNPCGPALSFSRLTASSPVSNLEVVRPLKQFSNHDYAGASYSSSARPTTCLELMRSSPADIDHVLLSTPQISSPDDHIVSSTSSTDAYGDHPHRRHYLESDIAAEGLQPPSAIASCGPHRSSHITSLKREIQSRNSTSRPCRGSSSRIQPYLLQPCHTYTYTTAHKDYDDIVQHVNATHDGLIIRPAAGLDLELRLGRKYS